MSNRLFISSDRFAKEIGHDYGATATSTVQAELFNGFAEGFTRSVGDALGQDMQLYYVARDMSPGAREVFKALAIYLEED